MQVDFTPCRLGLSDSEAQSECWTKGNEGVLEVARTLEREASGNRGKLAKNPRETQEVRGKGKRRECGIDVAMAQALHAMRQSRAAPREVVARGARCRGVPTGEIDSWVRKAHGTCLHDGPPILKLILHMA